MSPDKQKTSLDEQNFIYSVYSRLNRLTMVNDINAERALRHKRAGEKLLEGDVDGAEKDLAWIKASSRWLVPVKREKWLYIGIFCIMVFVCLCNLYYATDVVFELETESVTLTTNDQWNVKPEIIAEEVYADHLVMLKAPGLQIDRSYPHETSASAELSDGKIEVRTFCLENMNTPETAETDLQITGDMVKLLVKKGRITGSLQTRRADFELDGENIRIDKESSQIIRFETSYTVDDPVQFEFVSISDWALRGIHVQQIDFLKKISENPPIFMPAVISGRITVLETGKTQVLQKSDNLIVEITGCRRLDISKGEKGIKIAFEGTVSKILAGPIGFEENMTLTWIEYLWNRKALTIFLLALLSFLGKNFYLGD